MDIINNIKYAFSLDGGSYELNASETLNFDGDITNTVQITKTCDRDSKIYYSNDTVIFTITVTIGNLSATPPVQILTDVLDKNLQYVEDTLYINEVKSSDNLESIKVNFEPNSTNIVTYQCIVL